MVDEVKWWNTEQGVLDQATLDKIAIGFHAIINERYLLDAKVSLYSILDEMVEMKIRGFLWGEEAIKGKEIRYPADWWQAFKDRFFPVWLKERYPVKYVVHKIDLTLVYPEFRPALPTYKYSMIIRDSVDVL